MGMIPVVLAIAGFILLWVIVNYNSLSARQRNIVLLETSREQLFNSYTNLTKKLSALLLIYGKDMPPYIISFANEPGKIVDRTKLNKALEQIHKQAPGHLQGNTDYPELMREIEATAGRLLKNQRQLQVETKAYNQQATRMPYRIVAHLFGFKPIDSGFL